MESAKVEIDFETAKALLNAFNEIRTTDAIYLPCQNDMFRLHVTNIMKAGRVNKAIESLKQILDAKQFD